MNRLINASAHDTGIEDGSVHCILTSPPYLGLRKYQGNQGVMWQSVTYAPMAGLPTITIPAMQCDLGMEPTPEAYIGHLMLVMREMWRVLRDDGVCWVNLGDSYNGSGGAGGDYGEGGLKFGQPKYPGRRIDGLKPKDLCMIPARFALAAQADGWYLRSDIIWAKPNPMPESVTDRPTKAHEYIYLLTKSPKYFYDAEAIKEPLKDVSVQRLGRGVSNENKAIDGYPGRHRIPFTKHAQNVKFGGNKAEGYGTRLHSGNEWNPTGGANKRSVWTVATQNYSGSHFATWPEKLCEPMILAGTSAKGVCPKCGAQHERITEKGSVSYQDTGNRKRADALGAETSPTSVFRTGEIREILTTGWQPTCTCDAGEPIPATVLDPFNGSGTSGRVANRLGRNYIGVDISNEYLTELSPERLSNIQTQMCF